MRTAPERGRRTAAQQAGDAAEDAAATYLLAKGWSIIARQLRVGRGEVDLVAIDPGPPRLLVIVEVRWRRSRAFGLAEETVDHRKRAHLRAAIGRLLDGTVCGGPVLPSLPIRVDLVVVEPALDPLEPLRIRHHRAIPL